MTSHASSSSLNPTWSKEEMGLVRDHHHRHQRTTYGQRIPARVGGGGGGSGAGGRGGGERRRRRKKGVGEGGGGGRVCGCAAPVTEEEPQQNRGLWRRWGERTHQIIEESCGGERDLVLDLDLDLDLTPPPPRCYWRARKHEDTAACGRGGSWLLPEVKHRKMNEDTRPDEWVP